MPPGAWENDITVDRWRTSFRAPDSCRVSLTNRGQCLAVKCFGCHVLSCDSSDVGDDPFLLGRGWWSVTIEFEWFRGHSRSFVIHEEEQKLYIGDHGTNILMLFLAFPYLVPIKLTICLEWKPFLLHRRQKGSRMDSIVQIPPRKATVPIHAFFWGCADFFWRLSKIWTKVTTTSNLLGWLNSPTLSARHKVLSQQHWWLAWDLHRLHRKNHPLLKLSGCYQNQKITPDMVARWDVANWIAGHRGPDGCRWPNSWHTSAVAPNLIPRLLQLGPSLFSHQLARVMLGNERQCSNAKTPMWVCQSRTFERRVRWGSRRAKSKDTKIRLLKEMHLSKTEFTVTLVKDLQSQKALLYLQCRSVTVNPEGSCSSVSCSHERHHLQCGSVNPGGSRLSVSCTHERHHLQCGSVNPGGSRSSKSCILKRHHLQCGSVNPGGSCSSVSCSHEKPYLQVGSVNPGGSCSSVSCSHERHNLQCGSVNPGGSRLSVSCSHERPTLQCGSVNPGGSCSSVSCSHERHHLQCGSVNPGGSRLSVSCTHERHHLQCGSVNPGGSRSSVSCSHERHHLQCGSVNPGGSCSSVSCSHEKPYLQVRSVNPGGSRSSVSCSHERHHLQCGSVNPGGSRLSVSCTHERHHLQCGSVNPGGSRLSVSCTHERHHLQCGSVNPGGSRSSVSCSHERHHLQCGSVNPGGSRSSKSCSAERHNLQLQSQSSEWSDAPSFCIGKRHSFQSESWCRGCVHQPTLPAAPLLSVCNTSLVPWWRTRPTCGRRWPMKSATARHKTREDLRYSQYMVYACICSCSLGDKGKKNKPLHQSLGYAVACTLAPSEIQAEMLSSFSLLSCIFSSQSWFQGKIHRRKE